MLTLEMKHLMMTDPKWGTVEQHNGDWIESQRPPIKRTVWIVF
jgi:hypothetical protein